jgi:multiple sugar transport system permease protein
MKKQYALVRKEVLVAWLFITPFLIGFALFKLYPMIYGFLISFLDRNSARKLSTFTFVGLSNYIKTLSSSTVWVAFGHTLLFSLVYTVLTIGCALLVALLFNKQFPGRTTVRTLFYMPYVTNIIAVGIVWKYLLHPYNGPVNSLLGAMGVPKERLPQWLSGVNSALPTVAFIASWAALAFPLITFLAAMQDNPRDLYEVADLEGVNSLQRFRYVTLPLLMPTVFLLLTITIINSFKNFSIIAGLTAGGPGTATLVASYQIYNDAFIYMKFSIASAQGVLLTLLIFLINWIVTRGKKKWEA